MSGSSGGSGRCCSRRAASSCPGWPRSRRCSPGVSGCGPHSVTGAGAARRQRLPGDHHGRGRTRTAARKRAGARRRDGRQRHPARPALAAPAFRGQARRGGLARVGGVVRCRRRDLDWRSAAVVDRRDVPRERLARRRDRAGAPGALRDADRGDGRAVSRPARAGQRRRHGGVRVAGRELQVREIHRRAATASRCRARRRARTTW